VLAEAVETVAQHARLLERGCDEVQGYLVGRPAWCHTRQAFEGELNGKLRRRPRSLC
jgi:EAL domain-containing protein (putative c-di-GMP-specific phosphodiesterase class I)